MLGHIGLIVWLGLTASHRIAGPLYRLKQAMKEVTAGDMRVRIKLRDGDQLTDMASIFNAMMERLAAGRKEAESAISELPPFPESEP